MGGAGVPAAAVPPAGLPAAAGSAAAGSAAAAGGGYDQVLAQLKDLGDLKAQGVLSEEEFETQKRRILGG